MAEGARLAALRAEVGLLLGRTEPLRPILQAVAELMVRSLGVAFFRIWKLNETTNVLELEASAGLYTHLDGLHSRVPVGHLKIGRIAERRLPHLTNDVSVDPEISNPQWANEQGMKAFAGYPLVVGDRLVGVMATFSRQPLTETVLDDLASAAEGTAQCILRKQSQEALDRSNDRLRRQQSALAALTRAETLRHDDFYLAQPDGSRCRDSRCRTGEPLAVFGKSHGARMHRALPEEKGATLFGAHP